MTKKDYYVPDVKKAKDMSKDLGEYKGVMSRYIDSSDGSMQVKVEQEVLVDRMANTIKNTIASLRSYPTYSSSARFCRARI